MKADAIISQELLGDFCGVLDNVHVCLYSDRIMGGLVFFLPIMLKTWPCLMLMFCDIICVQQENIKG